jgi:hypothetical protein
MIGSSRIRSMWPPLILTASNRVGDVIRHWHVGQD